MGQAEEGPGTTCRLYPFGESFDQGFFASVIPDGTPHREKRQAGIGYLHPWYELLHGCHYRLKGPGLGTGILGQGDDCGTNCFCFPTPHPQGHSSRAR
jgi:hypothetical protein